MLEVFLGTPLVDLDGRTLRADGRPDAIQRRLVTERTTPGAPERHVRIGRNLGEPVAAHDDLCGTAVSLARRV